MLSTKEKLQNELQNYNKQLAEINAQIGDNHSPGADILIKRSRVKYAVYITLMQLEGSLEFVSNGVPGQASSIIFK